MHKPFIIAIDGGVATGKSTLASRLAKRYGFEHLNTGLLYRAVGYAVKQKNIALGDETEVTAMAHRLATNGLDKYLTHPDLPLEEIGQLASIVAQYQGVRQALMNFQRDFPMGKKGVVVEGRDITTVIFPFAQAKIFVTASPDVRAKRRVKELQTYEGSVNYDAILVDVQARDARDAWNIGTITPDAYVLDNSEMNADECEAAADAYIQKKLSLHFEA